MQISVTALMLSLPSAGFSEDITSKIVSFGDWSYIHLKATGEKSVVSLEKSRSSETARTETGVSVSCHGFYFDAMAPIFVHDPAKNRTTVNISSFGTPNKGWDQPLNLQPDGHIAGIASTPIMWAADNHRMFFLSQMTQDSDTLYITFRYADGELHRSSFSMIGLLDAMDYLASICST